MQSVIRKKVLYLLVAAFLFPFFFILKANSDDCNSIMRTVPYLQSPTQNSMVVRWVTKLGCEGQVEYAQTRDSVSSGVARKIGKSGRDIIHHFNLTFLKSGQEYFYRVKSMIPAYNGNTAKVEYSAIYSFKTIADTYAGDFTLMVFNDLHPTSRGEKLNKFIENISPYIDTISADLIVFNGDCFDEIREEKYLSYWLGRFVDFTHNSKVPSVFVMGNHEYDNRMADPKNNFEDMKLKKYIGFVQNGVSYGMLRLGETQFLFLDTGQEEAQRQLEIDHEQFDDGWKFIYNGEYFRNYRARQRTYISDTLLVSDDIKSRNTILIHHIPFFGNHTNNDLKDIYQEIGGDLINDLNVKLAINGHIHYFRTVNKERWNGYYNGIVYKNNYPYITAGGPDSPWIPGYIENPLGEIYSMLVLKKKGNQYLIDYYSMSNNLQIQKKYYEINNKGQIVSI